ncbi:MAG: MOSC domain-containing protein [Actinobacteria bacterium]|nr:MOSC domain-containing protein [Actinomycetota bacterium]
MEASAAGIIASLWRYPVKSMMGEELNASVVTERGLLGDRAFALTDRETGKVVSAKEPRKWQAMFEFRAAYSEPPGGNGLQPVRITLPDGAAVITNSPNFDQALSGVLGREVAFEASAPSAPSLEEYWPAIEGLDHQDVITEEAMPEGTFFDAATVHVLTTSTINRLRELYPAGRFEVRRFRPNVVVETEAAGFVENDWVGRELTLGEDVRLRVVKPCPRCVMTTLPQFDLPKDPGILRAAAKHNAANVGVYASVLQGGRVTRGDQVLLA